MKRLLIAALTPLLLVGCNGDLRLPTASKAMMTAVVEGARIKVDREITAEGRVKRFKSETTQPRVGFNVAAGSPGVTFTRYKVELQGNDGGAFGGEISSYERSIGLRVEGGWYCTSNEAGGTISISPVASCPPQDLVAAPRQVTYGDSTSPEGINLVQSELDDRIVEYFAIAGVCPDLLRMDITFYGYDDNKNPVTVKADDANIGLTCNTVPEGSN